MSAERGLSFERVFFRTSVRRACVPDTHASGTRSNAVFLRDRAACRSSLDAAWTPQSNTCRRWTGIVFSALLHILGLSQECPFDGRVVEGILLRLRKTAARSVFPCNVSLHRIRVGSIMAYFRGVAAMNRIRIPKRWFAHLFCALTNKDRQSNRRIQLQTATPYGNGERRNEPEKSFACERRG